VSFFKDELSKGLSRWWLVAAVFGSVTLAVISIGILLRVRQMYRAYLAAQSLLGEVRKIAPFLERYRNEVERRWR
jgi:hypothetical protein